MASAGPSFPPQRGRGYRPAPDNRQYLEGMMWIARAGDQQPRRLSDETDIQAAFFPALPTMVETGVFDAMPGPLAEIAGRDAPADMIDSTVARAHLWAAGKNGESGNRGAWPIAERRLHQAPRRMWTRVARLVSC
jgi:hypothetical protein